MPARRSVDGRARIHQRGRPRARRAAAPPEIPAPPHGSERSFRRADRKPSTPRRARTPRLPAAPSTRTRRPLPAATQTDRSSSRSGRPGRCPRELSLSGRSIDRRGGRSSRKLQRTRRALPAGGLLRRLDGTAQSRASTTPRPVARPACERGLNVPKRHQGPAGQRWSVPSRRATPLSNRAPGRLLEPAARHLRTNYPRTTERRGWPR